MNAVRAVRLGGSYELRTSIRVRADRASLGTDERSPHGDDPFVMIRENGLGPTRCRVGLRR